MPVDPVFINVQYINTHVYVVYIELANTQISCVGCCLYQALYSKVTKIPRKLIIIRECAYFTF